MFSVSYIASVMYLITQCGILFAVYNSSFPMMVRDSHDKSFNLRRTRSAEMW